MIVDLKKRKSKIGIRLTGAVTNFSKMIVDLKKDPTFGIRLTEPC
jgi:hypothetical protein